jgi:hypothetical protein
MPPTIVEELEALLDAFQRGDIPFDVFSSRFSDTYIENADQLPDDDRTSLYDAIHEQLEWTAEAPPDADRAWGWIDPNEFRVWLAAMCGGPHRPAK